MRARVLGRGPFELAQWAVGRGGVHSIVHGRPRWCALAELKDEDAGSDGRRAATRRSRSCDRRPARAPHNPRACRPGPLLHWKRVLHIVLTPLQRCAALARPDSPTSPTDLLLAEARFRPHQTHSPFASISARWLLRRFCEHDPACARTRRGLGRRCWSGRGNPGCWRAGAE